MSRFIIAFCGLAVVLLLGFQNCSNPAFSTNNGKLSSSGDPTLGATPAPSPGDPSCHAALTNLNVDVKVVLVVDTSTSNDSTDPNQQMRSKVVSEFYDEYKNKSNFGWNAISFGGKSAVLRLTESSGGTVDDFVQYLLNDKNVDNISGTPLDSALEVTTNLLKNYSESNSQTKYIVVLLSDGGSATSDKQVNEVKTLIATRPGRVTVNTVYYGSEHDTDTLKLMAEAGGGAFLNTNVNPTGKDFVISDHVQVPGVACN